MDPARKVHFDEMLWVLHRDAPKKSALSVVLWHRGPGRALANSIVRQIWCVGLSARQYLQCYLLPSLKNSGRPSFLKS